MPGYVTFHSLNGKHGDVHVSGKLLEKVRAVGAKQGVPIPKRISTGGCYGNYFWVCFTTNKMKEIILQQASKMKLRVRD